MPRSRAFSIILTAAALSICVGAAAQLGYFQARPVNPPMPMARVGSGFWVPPYYEPMYTIPQPAVIQPQILPQTTSSIEAGIDKEGMAHIKWQGEAGAVERIVFSLLDAEKKVIVEQKVDRLPTEARFPLTNKSAYYRVTVHYLNGTTNTITSLL
jgi:hypothetical protein